MSKDQNDNRKLNQHQQDVLNFILINEIAMDEAKKHSLYTIKKQVVEIAVSESIFLFSLDFLQLIAVPGGYLENRKESLSQRQYHEE